ncbi:uncharacterized protein LOC133328545 [Musca vetustissima]|uniref:uncharacterized protein LOC133328545 n=1 Tax=Musca vetustissima TaxID=27455 RepID=UPI002AB620E0|nr:uncharacterized protein LOC133328545 [Musca vetustissima]
MKIFIIFLALLAGNIQFSHGLESSLLSRNFQKDFLQELSRVMKRSAMQAMNKYLRELKSSGQKMEDPTFDQALSAALNSKKLGSKVVFLKQWFDLSEHRDANRENMYGLRNVLFLEKLKDRFYDLQEESFEEMHNLRYYYICKQYNVNGNVTQEKEVPHHNLYAKNVQLAPMMEESVANALEKLGIKDNHTISINVKEFGEQLYHKVNHTGAELIDDYLVVIGKLLQEVLENKEETSASHNEALEKILAEIGHLLNTTDFYSKRQRLYDYLQNHMSLDVEEFQNTENSQQDLVAIFEKLKQKGLDLIVAFLFSNFEFIDYTHGEWEAMLPEAPILLVNATDGSRQLMEIQQLYMDFKKDFENSSKYDAYLEAVRLLHERTQRENADTTHIYEMLYSAAQNVGSTRVLLMDEKCKEV